MAVLSLWYRVVSHQGFLCLHSIIQVCFLGCCTHLIGQHLHRSALGPAAICMAASSGKPKPQSNQSRQSQSGHVSPEPGTGHSLQFFPQPLPTRLQQQICWVM